MGLVLKPICSLFLAGNFGGDIELGALTGSEFFCYFLWVTLFCLPFSLLLKISSFWLLLGLDGALGP